MEEKKRGRPAFKKSQKKLVAYCYLYPSSHQKAKMIAKQTKRTKSEVLAHIIEYYLSNENLKNIDIFKDVEV